MSMSTVLSTCSQGPNMATTVPLECLLGAEDFNCLQDIGYSSPSLYNFPEAGINKSSTSTSELEQLLWSTPDININGLWGSNPFSSDDLTPPMFDSSQPASITLGSFCEPFSVDTGSSYFSSTPASPLLLPEGLSTPTPPVSPNDVFTPMSHSNPVNLYQSDLSLTDKLYSPHNITSNPPSVVSVTSSVETTHSSDTTTPNEIPKKSKRRKVPVAKKKERKKEQNKTAALRYRQRKRDESRQAEERQEILERKNAQLKEDIEGLESEISYLKKLWIDIHKAQQQKRHTTQ